MRFLLAALALAFSTAAAAQAEEEEPDPRLEFETPDVEPPAPPAPVLQDRPLMVRVGGALAWDTNIFRAPIAREERIASAYAGLSIDKAYAQQRIRADVTEVAYRFDNFPQLDFNALNYRGTWDWHLGPRIGGALNARREQALADYSEFRNPGQRNTRTTEYYALGADAWLFGGWHLTGALSQVRDRFSVPFPQQGSYRADGGEAGVRWVAPSANWLAFNLRSLDGRYVDRVLDPVARLDDGFRRDEAEGLVFWRTGKSILEGRLAHIDYRSNNFAERDFSGLAARMRYVWQAMAKLALDAALARAVEPWGDVSANHLVEDRVTVGPVWQAAARTTLRLELTRMRTGFRDPLPGFVGPERRDAQRSVQFEAEWRALRNLSLKASAQRYRRSSNDPAANFHGSQLAAAVSFLF